MHERTSIFDCKEGTRHALQVRIQPVPKGIMYVFGLFGLTLIPNGDPAGRVDPRYDFPLFLSCFIRNTGDKIT
jgi:hypothetical protein